MKILLLSDIHSRIKNLQELVERAKNKEMDLILIAGDLTNFGGERETREVIEEIKKLEKKIFAVPGNLDTKETLLFLEKEKISLHSKKEQFKDFVFVGFGGATNCIGDGETIFAETEIYEKLKELLINEKKKKVFLLTHAPPKNCLLDKSFSGKHVGSESVKKIISEFSPEFCVSGHCHEAFGKEIIEKTFCINASSVKHGKMALLDTKTKEMEWIGL